MPINKILPNNNSDSNGTNQNGNSSVYQNSSANASANSIDKKIEPTIVYERTNSESKSKEPETPTNIVTNAVFSSVKNKISEANKLTSESQQQILQPPQIITTTVTTPVSTTTPVSFNILREKKTQNNTATLNTPASQTRANKTKSGTLTLDYH
jgi:hypothetical protein